MRRLELGFSEETTGAWSPLAQTLRGAGVLYHETTESTISAEWTPIEIPSDAAGTLWAPTPSHRVLAMLDADLAGESYGTSTTYRVGPLS